MEKKREICEYRDKLDKNLSSPELTNHKALKSLVRNQLCSFQECSENIIDERTDDVSKLLSKLRSVCMADNNGESLHGDWKLKQDLEDCRVMYREGIEGSPFHTMLVEGYMDGPIQDCLCVSWESILYKKWWPQFAFPPFRILKTTCLQKIRIGEQISLVRMKVPWPLTDREIILHYFLIEYFKDDLVIILLNTISDLDSIGILDIAKNVIPESSDAVRIDVVGGFVLQKVTSERSYFRLIGDLDIKLDFVPPSLMNFITRQLIGNGFKLYKKAVASVAKFDEDYSKALADPLYTNIRQALYSTETTIEEESKLDSNKVNGENEHENDEDELFHCRRTVTEIEEEEEDSEVGNQTREFCISPEVEQALGTLERIIYMVRNISPVQEAEELSPEEEIKQVSMSENIENLSQRSQRQEEKIEKETGQKDLRRKRKTSCFAFSSWLGKN